jgi:transposase
MSCERPFAEVARDLNVSTNVVRAIFWRTAHQADALLSPTAPRILGIDEVHLPRQTCAVFVDAETGAVVDLLPSYSRAAVAEGIQRLAGFESIEAITMDFAGAYAAAVRDVYGDAAPPIVLDKRHVLEVARRAMDSVRKEKRRRMKPGRRREIARLMNARRPTLLEDDRQQLERVLRAHPDLRAAHDLKERFYSIFERSDRATAERAFDVWSDSIPADLEETFRPVANVVTQRRQDVFAAFDWPGVTNARTENLNGRLKELHRRVRGYDVDGFEAFRLLALHKLGERQPDVVAERFAAQAILDGRAPWRERTEEELEALLAQAADKIDSGR